jgi:hypothetical protein
MPFDAKTPIDNAVAMLINLQRGRIFSIRMQSTFDRKTDSYIVSVLSRSGEYEHLSLKAKHEIAARIRKSICTESGDLPIPQGSVAAEALSLSTLLIKEMGEARGPIDRHRKDFETRMEQIVKKLPVYKFIKKGKHPRLTLGQGFAAKGMAIVLGEAGNPSNYATIARFWKRLCVGIVDNERQQRKSGLSQDEVLRIGYKPERRAEMWMLADSMYKHQVTHAAKCPCLKCTEGKKSVGDGPTPLFEAKNAYGHVFIEEYYKCRRERGATHGHAYAHARRVMWKEALLDFWQAWRAADGIQIEFRNDYPTPPLAPPDDDDES